MGCPDWPKCFDRWIPPTNIEQLPDHIDPALFNIVLAWIEYCNRLFGAFVGLLISVTMFLALKHHSSNFKIKFAVISAFILTSVLSSSCFCFCSRCKDRSFSLLDQFSSNSSS